jgi:hypothetical protein
MSSLVSFGFFLEFFFLSGLFVLLTVASWDCCVSFFVLFFVVIISCFFPPLRIQEAVASTCWERKDLGEISAKAFCFVLWMLQLHSFRGNVNDFLWDGIGIEWNGIEEGAIPNQTTRSLFVLQQYGSSSTLWLWAKFVGCCLLFCRFRFSGFPIPFSFSFSFPFSPCFLDLLWLLALLCLSSPSVNEPTTATFFFPQEPCIEKDPGETC